MADIYEHRKRFLDAGWKLEPVKIYDYPTSYERIPEKDEDQFRFGKNKNKPTNFYVFPVPLGAYKSCPFPAKATLPKPLNKWTKPDPISGETVDERVLQLPGKDDSGEEWFGIEN